MAISWGSWAGDMQVGIDITRTPSTVTKDTSSVSYRTKIYIGYRNGHNFNGTLTYTGYYGNGSQTYRLDHPWGGAAASRLIVDRSASYTIHYDKTVASNVRAETTVVWNGSKPFKKVDFTIPRRPYHTPRAPKSPSATRNSDTQATVKWTRDADSASGARPWSGVYIERQSASNTSWTRIATVTGTGTSYTDKGISANNRFRYRVISYNSAGSSSAVNTGYVITTPTSPNNVTATKDASGNILVKWTNRANYQTGVKVYDNGTLVATLTTAATQWTHGSPNTSITHTYTVRAVAGSLDSALSSPSNTVQLMAPPLAPTGFKAINSTVAQEDGEPIRFEWNHNPVDSSEQVARQFSYKTPGSSTWTIGTKYTTGDEWSLTSTPGGSSPTLGTWTWRVRTWGQDPDPSPWSSEITTVVDNRPQIAVQTPASDSIIETNAVTASWNYSQAQGRAQRGRLLRLIDTTNGAVEVWRDERNTTSTSWAIPFTLQDDSQYQLAITVIGTNGLASQEQIITFGVDYLEPDPAEVNIDWDTEAGYNNVGIHNPDTNPEVVSNRVFRNVDPDSPWSKVKPDATPQEPVFNYFTNPNPVGDGTWAEVRRNYILNPYMVSLTGWSNQASTLNVVEGGIEVSIETGSSSIPVLFTSNLPGAGIVDKWSAGIDVTVPADSPELTIRLIVHSYGEGGVVASSGAVTIQPGETVRLEAPSTTSTSSATTGVRAILYTAGNQYGKKFIASKAFLERAPKPGPMKDPDLRLRWLGDENASESVMEIERVRGLTGVNAIAGVSTWEGKPAVRLIPLDTSVTSSRAWFPVPSEARADGTMLGTLHLAEPLSGRLHVDALRLRTAIPAQVSDAPPNAPGSYPLRLRFGGMTSAYQAQINNGATIGSGDVWWTDIGIFAGDYQGEWFGGDGIQQDPESGLIIEDTWVGEPNNSHTQRVIRYPEFIDSEWELVGEAEANGSITDYEGLTYGITAYAVDSITSIGSSSRSYKTIEVYDDRVWLSHYDTRRTATLFYNIKREFGSEKVNSELFDFDGRTDPVLIEGEAINSTLTVTGKIDPYEVMGTSWRDFERVAELAGMFVYRDKDGRRWYARLTGVSEQIDSSKRRNVTFTVTRLERPDNEPIQ